MEYSSIAKGSNQIHYRKPFGQIDINFICNIMQRKQITVILYVNYGNR